MGSVQRAFALNESSTEFRKLWEGENLEIGWAAEHLLLSLVDCTLTLSSVNYENSLKAFQARQTPQWKPSKL